MEPHIQEIAIPHYPEPAETVGLWGELDLMEIPRVELHTLRYRKTAAWDGSGIPARRVYAYAGERELTA
jgi:hypothetical protein